MIYDVASNFVGDTHWQEAAAIQDGDELRVDQGLIIQVSEQVGRKEQDISELLEKRKVSNGQPQRQISQGATYPVQSLGLYHTVQKKAKPISAILARGLQRTTNATSPSQPRRNGIRLIDTIDPPTKRSKVSHATTFRDAKRSQQSVIETLPQPITHERTPKHQLTTTTATDDKQYPLEEQDRPKQKAEGIAYSQEILRPAGTNREQRGAGIDTQVEATGVPMTDSLGQPRHSGLSEHQAARDQPLQVLLSKKTKRKKLVCEGKKMPTDKFQTRRGFNRQSSSVIDTAENASDADSMDSTLRAVTETDLNRFKFDTPCYDVRKGPARYLPKKVKDKPGRAVSDLSISRGMSARDACQGSTATTGRKATDFLSESANFQHTNSARAYRQIETIVDGDHEAQSTNIRKSAQRPLSDPAPRLPKLLSDRRQELASRQLISRKETENSAGPWTREAFDLFGWCEGSSKARRMLA